MFPIDLQLLKVWPNISAMSEQFPVLGYILENIKVGSIKQYKKPPMTLSHGNDRQKKMSKHFLIMTLSIISLLTNGNRAEA